MKIPNGKYARQRGIVWWLVGLIILAVVAILVWVVVQVLNSLGNLFPKKPPTQPGQIVPNWPGGVDPRIMRTFRPYGLTVLPFEIPVETDGTNIQFPLVVRAGNTVTGPWDTVVFSTNWIGNPTNLPNFVNSMRDASNTVNWKTLDPLGTNAMRFYNIREER